MIEHTLQLLEEGSGVYVVLLRKLVEQQLRVVGLGMQHGLCELVEQEVDDSDSRKIDVNDVSSAV